MFKYYIQLIRKALMSPNKYARKMGVVIGKGCSIATKNFPTEGYLVEIGDYVRIATKTSFFTHGGVYTLRKMQNDPDLDHFGKIKIGDYTYIGEGCMIMPGVIIGEKCIVGAGSVVTKSIPDGCMVAGNPAKFIGYTADFYKRLKETSDCGLGRVHDDEEKRNALMSLPESKFETKPYIKIQER